MPLIISILCITLSFIPTSLIAIPAVEKKPIVQIQTSVGPIIIRLFPNEAPITCANFLNYVREGFYDQTLIHRVIDGFIIQGGGFTPDFIAKKTKAPIPNESRQGLSNLKYTVSMALTTDNHSAASQFFFNLADNIDLNYTTKKGRGYTVFAEVIDGKKVLDTIRNSRTRRITIYSELYKRDVPLHDVPEQQILIEKMIILR